MVTSRHLSDDATLSAALAANSVMLQLYAAVVSITLVLVLDVKLLLGLGPAIVLTAGALAAVPAGRLIDRFGRRPLRPGTWLEPVVRGGHRGARRPDRAIGARPPARVERSAVQRDRRGTDPARLIRPDRGGGSALAIGAMALLVAPALWILRAGAAAPSRTDASHLHLRSRV
jgi:hypothetical protein